jgi:hypothetical protein
MEEEKRRLEEQLLCIDRKKQVQGQESTYAHNVAQKYRLEQEHSHLIDQEIKNLKSLLKKLQHILVNQK